MPMAASSCHDCLPFSRYRLSKKESFMTEVTRILARYVVQSRLADIPANVQQEAVRSFLNWLGCAVGGSIHPTVDRALAALRPFAGPGQASVLGRKDRLDILHAALINGISSHVFDFDDTHLKT